MKPQRRSPAAGFTVFTGPLDEFIPRLLMMSRCCPMSSNTRWTRKPCYSQFAGC